MQKKEEKSYSRAEAPFLLFFGSTTASTGQAELTNYNQSETATEAYVSGNWEKNKEVVLWAAHKKV